MAETTSETGSRGVLRTGAPKLGAFMLLPDPVAGEIMARAGWDVLTIDMQHGAIGYDDAFSLLQVLSLGSALRLVRVPSLGSELIGRMLDAGAEGIIAPMIETADQVERLVTACTYPPRGQRSFGPLRPAMVEGMTAYAATANDRILPIAMIETAAALDRLDDILVLACRRRSTAPTRSSRMRWPALSIARPIMVCRSVCRRARALTPSAWSIGAFRWSPHAPTPNC